MRPLSSHTTGRTHRIRRFPSTLQRHVPIQQADQTLFPEPTYRQAFLHGRTGERLSSSVGRLGFLARELPAEIPRALAEITG